MQSTIIPLFGLLSILARFTSATDGGSIPALDNGKRDDWAAALFVDPGPDAKISQTEGWPTDIRSSASAVFSWKEADLTQSASLVMTQSFVWETLAKGTNDTLWRMTCAVTADRTWRGMFHWELSQSDGFVKAVDDTPPGNKVTISCNPGRCKGGEINEVESCDGFPMPSFTTFDRSQ